MFLLRKTVRFPTRSDAPHRALPSIINHTQPVQAQIERATLSIVACPSSIILRHPTHCPAYPPASPSTAATASSSPPIIAAHLLPRSCRHSPPSPSPAVSATVICCLLIFSSSRRPRRPPSPSPRQATRPVNHCPKSPPATGSRVSQQNHKVKKIYKGVRMCIHVIIVR